MNGKEGFSGMPTGLRLEKRGEVPLYINFLIPVFCIVLALIVCAGFIRILGFEPGAVYLRMLRGGFGSLPSFFETVIKAIPLMLCGLAVAVAYKMLLMNIGAEGQFCVGALAATGVALFWSQSLPGWSVIWVMLLASFLAGALWAVLAVLPRAYLGVSEIIVTLMFNYIAILLLDFFVYGPWKDPGGANMPLSAPFAPEALLFKFPGTNINGGLLMALVIAVILYVVFRKTTWGFQLSVIGESCKSAGYAGMNISRNMLITMVISGGISGLAGLTEVAGVVGRLQPGISAGYGYTAIIIAYISRFNPLIILLVSLLFGGMSTGGYGLQILGLPSQIVNMLQGAILLFVLGGEILTRYKVRLVRPEREVQ